MNIVFGNIAGLWALLGVPTLLAIHFIQQRYKKVTISTLFLLEGSKNLQTQTRKIDWIRNSLQLWVQLLAIVCVALILSEPAIESQRKIQRIAYVVDSSYSMSAFQDKILEFVEQSMESFSSQAEYTEWTLVESAPYSGVLYRGSDKGALLAALKIWKPRIGRHPIDVELDARRRLLGETTRMIFLSDHLQNTSRQIEQHSIGHPIENWGISGFNVNDEDGKPVFEAVVRNYGSKKATRNWWVKIGDAKKNIGQITLNPGQFTTLRTSMPRGVDSQVIGIDSDEFVLDDSMPLVRPKMNKLMIYLQRSRLTSRLRSLVYSIENIRRVNVKTKADIILQSFRTAPITLDKGAIQVYDSGDSRRDSRSTVVAQRHPLLSHLRWDGLSVGSVAKSKPSSSTRVLLWAKDQPAVYLSNNNKSLIVAFDIRNSNALEHPAFVILLHRFIASARRDTPGYWRFNVSTSQKLSTYLGDELLKDSKLGTVDLSGDGEEYFTRAFRAPAQPGFFRVIAADSDIAIGAAGFGDASESDFSGFAPGSLAANTTNKDTLDRGAINANQTLWLILLLVLLCASWVSTTSYGSLATATGRS